MSHLKKNRQTAKYEMKKIAKFWKKKRENDIECKLCPHNCTISDGDFGFCNVRKNCSGILYAFAYGNTIANRPDPIEKKPFYHFLPGTSSYSIAVKGCNMRCSFCQNWQISQIDLSSNNNLMGQELKPEEIVQEAIKNKCQSISYTYTEPTIFFEYAYEISKLAKQKGLKNAFITNGYISREAIDEISPYLDAANIDLKFFNEKSYRKLSKASLKPVLDTIVEMKRQNVWIEITTLLIPGVNDSDEELKDISGFISSVDKNIPWHIAKYHPDYMFNESPATSQEIIEKSQFIGKKSGLTYVYPGNTLSRISTLCPKCHAQLINREHFLVEGISNLKSGKCIFCGYPIAGIW